MQEYEVTEMQSERSGDAIGLNQKKGKNVKTRQSLWRRLGDALRSTSWDGRIPEMYHIPPPSHDSRIKNPLPSPRVHAPHQDQDSGRKWLKKFSSDPGVYFTQNPIGVVLFLVMGVLLLNMVIVLFLMILAPLSEFPSHSGEEVGFFGVSILLGGWIATLLYAFTVGIIVLLVYQVMKREGSEFIRLMKRELSVGYEDIQRTADMAKNHIIHLKQPKQFRTRDQEKTERCCSLHNPRTHLSSSV